MSDHKVSIPNLGTCIIVAALLNGCHLHDAVRMNDHQYVVRLLAAVYVCDIAKSAKEPICEAKYETENDMQPWFPPIAKEKKP